MLALSINRTQVLIITATIDIIYYTTAVYVTITYMLQHVHTQISGALPNFMLTSLSLLGMVDLSLPGCSCLLGGYRVDLAVNRTAVRSVGLEMAFTSCAEPGREDTRL